MSDNFREVQNESWLGRVGGSIFGAFIGLLLFIAAFPLEIWNEGRAIAEMKALEQGEKSVISVSASTVAPENDGKLIHISGQAETKEDLTDSEFGVKKNALKLVRKVEMYQWDEDRSTHTDKKLGGGSSTVTDYRYSKKWSSSLISSSSFHESYNHANPKSMPYHESIQYPSDAKLGAFALNKDQIDKLSNFEKLSIDKSSVQLPARAEVIDNYVFIGDNRVTPKIGDVQVRWSYIPLGTVSVVGKQQGALIVPFVADNGNTFELVQSGDIDAKAMFKKAESDSNLMTWAIRAGGVLVMFFGLILLGRPLTVLADVLPFVGSLLGADIGLMSFGISVFLSSLTIGLSWLAFRPLLAGGIIGVGVLTVVAFGVLSRKRVG